VSGGTRTTTTTPTRETAAVTTDRRTTTTEQPARTTATTRETAPAQTETAAVEAHVETGECPPNHTERFEGELTMMTATDRYAVIDTLDNRDALNSRTFVVSLCGEGKIECPAVTDRQTATVAETTIRTTTETDRRTLSATTGATTGGAALAERATAPRTITMAETITDTAALQQAQTISDTLRAEMLTQCPTIQRTPHAAIDAETGARFVTTTGDRTTYALGNSLKTFILLKTSGEEAPPEDVTPPQGEEEPVVEAPAPVVVPPKLDVLVEPADCQATLKATVFCSGTTDCTADYVIDAVVTSGKTVLLGSVTRVDDQTFLITPPKEGDEPAKGLSISLNKAELTGPVTITVTAKKGDEAPLEHMVNDVPNKDDLIAKCMQAKTEAAGDIPKAYDGTRPEQMPTGGSDISGGGWLGVGCSLVRR
jgi:hypothetical protein